MTFSLPRKRRTTRPARSTPSRTACSLLAAAAWLGLAGAAAADDGEARSKFRPRADGPPAQLVIPVQAKGGSSNPAGGSSPGGTVPGTSPGTTPPGGVVPGTGQPGKADPGTPPAKGAPGTPAVPGTGVPTPPNTNPGTPALPGTGGNQPGVGSVGPGAPGGTGGNIDPNPRTSQNLDENYVRLERPGREKLFGSRDSERELEERMRQEGRDAKNADEVRFPDKPKLTDEAYQTRRFAPMVELVEPSAVVYRRLYFEEKNAERYGWDLGPVQPFVSTLTFFKDTLLFPHNFASYPCRRFDTNAGQCLPGDPVPYIIYPPELTGSGLLAEVGVIALLFVAVP